MRPFVAQVLSAPNASVRWLGQRHIAAVKSPSVSSASPVVGPCARPPMLAEAAHKAMRRTALSMENRALKHVTVRLARCTGEQYGRGDRRRVGGSGLTHGVFTGCRRGHREADQGGDAGLSHRPAGAGAVIRSGSRHRNTWCSAFASRGRGPPKELNVNVSGSVPAYAADSWKMGWPQPTGVRGFSSAWRLRGRTWPNKREESPTIHRPQRDSRSKRTRFRRSDAGTTRLAVGRF